MCTVIHPRVYTIIHPRVYIIIHPRVYTIVHPRVYTIIHTRVYRIIHPRVYTIKVVCVCFILYYYTIYSWICGGYESNINISVGFLSALEGLNDLTSNIASLGWLNHRSAITCM